jgi:UDP-glucose 4-epimerase
MRVAVCGAHGLIGGHVCARLARREEVLRVGRHPDDAWNADLAEPDVVRRLDLSGVDAIVHCAGAVDEDFGHLPARALTQAVLGTEALAQAAARAAVRRFVYFSTSHVYGPLEGRVSEQTTTDPRSLYAIAHSGAEQVLRRVASETGMAVLVLRPNAVFGVPSDLGAFKRWHLIPYAFPRLAAYTERIELRTSGRQQRNFVAAGDLAGFVEAFLSQETATGVAVANAVGAETMSVLDFAHLCARVFEKASGRQCRIEVPWNPKHEAGEAFEFCTNISLYTPLERLEMYLEHMMRRLLRDAEDGHAYGG